VEPLPALGELETAVLEYLWARDRVEAKDAHRDVGTPRDITLTTIQSTLERLHRKRLAHRERVGHAYHYTPALSQAEFRARAVASAAGDLRGARAEGVLAAFVELAAGADAGNLERLAQLVEAARARRGGR
jgi:predicted transcriptional regulator